MANELAYGFVGLRHLFDQRLSDLNVNTINDAVVQSLAMHNQELSAMLDLAVTRTTAVQERFRLPGAGTLQPLDEWGNPIPVRTGAFADIGFPIQGGGTAWGTNRVSNALMTVAEANEYQVMVQTHDTDWMRRHILAQLLDNTPWTYADPEHGNVIVLPLANDDAQTYLRVDGTLATADHYTAQSAAIATGTNPFPTIRNTLSRYPGNNGPYVAYISPDQRADVEGLASFLHVSDPNIRLGANSDTVVGAPAGVQAFGEEVIGYADGVWIVVWASVPDDYVIAFAQGAASTAIAMREYPDGSLQGLFQENHSPDGNRFERRFIRYAGFGARNRTAALVHQVEKGDTTYVIPSGFETPLAV